MTRRLTDPVTVTVPWWVALIAVCFACGVAWGVVRALVVWAIP